MKRRIPESIDLTPLEFLEHGDRERIAKEDRDNGRAKTTRQYVSAVVKGHHRNDRILKRAFEIAFEKMGRYPKQAIKI